MSTFVDQAMLSLSDPAQLRELVDPATDSTHQRVRQLFSAVYALPFAALHDIVQVDVLMTDFQRPLFAPRTLSGTWTQTVPSHVRTDVMYEGLTGLSPEWLDLAARLALTVVLEVDPGEVESILIADIGEFASLAEFEAKFRYFDLAGFMAEHHITTVDELKRAYRYLLGEIKLAAPAAFNPADPANQRRFDLNLAVLIRDGIDVATCLRDARLARELMERTVPYRREVAEANVQTPYAPVLVLPSDAVAATGFTAAELGEFFAAQDVLAVFISP
jgi:hypothetical protein